MVKKSVQGAMVRNLQSALNCHITTNPYLICVLYYKKTNCFKINPILKQFVFIYFLLILKSTDDSGNNFPSLSSTEISTGM
ncbi:hypothetical protein NL50_15340 [Clostridium acetobutylicum]|nr:hypothetical protein NL50_15340 [Clostridium acetobutylicum]